MSGKGSLAPLPKATTARGLLSRHAWALLFTLLPLFCSPIHAADMPVRVSAARVWPAADFTRVTFESSSAIQHKVFSLENPDRLVLDLDNVDITPALTGLAVGIGDKDPYVKSVRVGRFRPGTIRLVFDLKATVKPQVFALAPVGQYGHRLVLDLYPLVPPDPLLAFSTATRRSRKARRRRRAPSHAPTLLSAAARPSRRNRPQAAFPRQPCPRAEVVARRCARSSSQ